MLNLKDVKNYHRLHNELQSTITQIVEFYNEINDVNNEIGSIEATKDGFKVVVQEWVGGGYWGGYWDSEDMIIDFELLTNANLFEKLKNQADDIKEEKDKRRKEDEADRKNKEIEKALELLKEHGRI